MTVAAQSRNCDYHVFRRAGFDRRVLARTYLSARTGRIVIRPVCRQDDGLRRSLSSGRALRGPGGLQPALRATATSRRWVRWRRWRRRDEDTVIARPDDGLREIGQI